VGTAGTLADRQMEAYRALSYGQIALSAAGTGSPYTPITGDTSSGDFDVTACSAGCVLGTASSEYTYCNTAPTTFPAPCTAIQPSVTGPDGRSYRVDTYIVWYCAIPPLQPPNGSSTVSIDSNVYTQASPGCLDSASPYTVNARPVKRITVVVRDATTSKTYVSETSTFDQAT
jgi:hypothetical protein